MLKGLEFWSPTIVIIMCTECLLCWAGSLLYPGVANYGILGKLPHFFEHFFPQQKSKNTNTSSYIVIFVKY